MPMLLLAELAAVAPPAGSFSTLFAPDNLAALATLTALEIVLGIDNVIFISILVARLPPEQRDRARLLGLGLAMFMRIALLFAISWIISLDKTVLFTALGHDFSGKDLVLLLGGLFLIAKSTFEIHHKIEGAEPVPGPDGHAAPVEVIPREHRPPSARHMTFASAIVQILLLDLVFSLDSVITAVGMSNNLYVMVTAVITAVLVMLVFSGFIARFVERHPTIKMLALAFLLLIGVMLVGESAGHHVPKGYIYFAMAFSLGVELLNLWSSKGKKH